MKRLYLALFLVAFPAVVAYANIASTELVAEATKDKVSTKGEETQTMAGKYVVTGSLEVPDAPLPSVDME